MHANLTNIVLHLDGVFRIFNNITLWPTQNNDGGPYCCFFFQNCSGVVLEGNGVIDGSGYNWWWFVIITGIDKRPHMLGIDGSENIQISGLTFLNSPQFHLYLTDVHNLHVNGINVTVEVDKQKHIFDP